MENRFSSSHYSSSNVDSKRFLKSSGEFSKLSNKTLLCNVGNLKKSDSSSPNHQLGKQTLAKIKFKNLDSLWTREKQPEQFKQSLNSCNCSCHQQISEMNNNKYPSYGDLAKMRKKINDIQSKISFYSNGVPCQFQENSQKIKLNNFKNNINTLQSPNINQLLKDQINLDKKASHKQKGKTSHCKFRHRSGYQGLQNVQSGKQQYLQRSTNLINKTYLKKGLTTSIDGHQQVQFTSYKDAMSQKQQFNKFFAWFQKKRKQLESRNPQNENKTQLLVKCYEQKQNLIASAFNEVLRQLQKFSKPRTQFIKHLWNEHNQKTVKLLDFVYKNHYQAEKQYLFNSKDMHEKYQEQIIKLRKANEELTQKHKSQKLINKTIINTIRQMRKNLKRSEISMKKLIECNSELKNQSLYLLNENTKFLYQKLTLINQAQTLKTLKTLRDIDFNNPSQLNAIFNQNSNEKQTCKEIKVLIYRCLMIQKERNKMSLKKYSDETANLLLKQIKKQGLSSKNYQQNLQNIPKLRKCRESILDLIENNGLNLNQKYQMHDLQNKKVVLYQYIQERIKQNPKQKLFIAHDYFSDDEQGLVQEGIVNSLLERKFISNGLVESIIQTSNYYGCNLKSFKQTLVKQLVKQTS